MTSCIALCFPPFIEKQDVAEMTGTSSATAEDEKKSDDLTLDFSNPLPLSERQLQSFEKNVVSAAKELDHALGQAFEQVTSDGFMCSSINGLNCLADDPCNSKQMQHVSPARSPTFEVDYDGADNKILETSNGPNIVTVIPPISGDKPRSKSLRSLFGGSKKGSNRRGSKNEKKNDDAKIPETIAIKKGYRQTWFGTKVKVPDRGQPKARTQKSRSWRFGKKAKKAEKSHYVHDKEATVQDGRQTVHTIQMHRIATGTLLEV